MPGDGQLQFPVPYGKYELLERIGDGGMAEVFRARFAGVAGFSKTVVIKRMLPHLAHKPQFVDMFVGEASLAAQVQHRNVVQVFELAQLDSGEYFIVMELVDGVDLRRLLKSAARRKLRVPAWFSVHVVIEVLEAIAYAHSLTDENGAPRNIVHRDVTPSNVFLSKLGEVKLGDFGVAHDTARPWQTQAGQLKGKVAYMAPEQLYTRSIDARTDLFAAGVLLWECLAQRRLFGGGPDIEVMNRIVNGPRRAVTHYAKDVPGEMDALLLRAVAVAPEDRFQSAKEMQDALLELAPRFGLPARSEAVRGVIDVMSGRAEPDTADVHPLAEAKRPSATDSHPSAAASRASSGFRSFSSTGTGSPVSGGPIEDPLYHQGQGEQASSPVAERRAVGAGLVDLTDDLAAPTPHRSPSQRPSDAEVQLGLSQSVTPPQPTPRPNALLEPSAGSNAPRPNALLDYHAQGTPPPRGSSRPSPWAPSRGPNAAPPLPPKLSELRPREPTPLHREASDRLPTDDVDAPPRMPPPRRPDSPIPLSPDALVPILEEPPASAFRAVTNRESDSDDIDALVQAAVDDVRNLPEARLEVVPHDSLLAGLDIRRHASRVSDHATKRWAAFGLDEREYTGDQPFWLRDNDGSHIGPCAYDKAIGIARTELRARLSESSEISIDDKEWMPLEDFAKLVGMESMLRHDDELVPKSGLLMGTLDRRSLTAVFGMLSRNHATGRLFVVERVHRGTDFREIEIQDGRPTYVYANEDRLQLPELLVAKGLVPAQLMGRLVHDAIREKRSLTSLTSAYLATDLARYGPLFMKERLVDVFARGTGTFTFEERTTIKHTRPFARSLNALLPELVHRAIDNDTLEVHLRPVMDADLRPCEHLGRRLDEMGLTRGQLGAASYLANGRKLSTLLRQWPEDRRLYLTMAYVLVETELLVTG